MKVDVPGRGAVDISRVAIVGPVWTDLDMYRETCALLRGTADAAVMGLDEWARALAPADGGKRKGGE